MEQPMTETFTAFEGERRLPSGPLTQIALALKGTTKPAASPFLIFSDATGRAIDLDLRGSHDEVLARLPSASPASPEGAASGEPRGRGRPKLGVVAREVTLLPRHWEWLNEQPGRGAGGLRE